MRVRFLWVILAPLILAEGACSVPAAEGQSRVLRRSQHEVVPESATTDADSNAYVRCWNEGTEHAKSRFESVDWFLGGLAAGSLLGPVGVGLAWAVSNADERITPRDFGERTGDCLVGFNDGFQYRARREKRKSAIGGGVIGTAVLLVVYLSLNN